MADDDVYASDPYEAPSIRIGTTEPAINEERAKGYLRQYDDKAKAHGATYEDIMKRRASAVTEIQRQLDGTIQEMREKRSGAGQGQVNLPLLALGAGLLQGSPAGTAGDFSQDLSRGLSGMGSAIQKQRMSDSDFLKGVAELQTKSGAMGDIPLRDQATNEQRQQMAAEAQRARLEVAMTKAGASGAGRDPVLVKEMNAENEARAKKGLPPLSPSEWYAWKSQTGGDKNTPADLRQLSEENKVRESKGQPPLSPSEWQTLKAQSAAGGRTTGEAQAKATQSLPGTMADIDNVETTINRVASHPGQKNAFGLTGMLPNYPGGDTADFNALREQLGSQAFLTSVSKMAGLGALSENEGKKLGDAAIQLSKTQSRKQFLENLGYFKQQVARTREIAKQKAGKPGEVVPPVVGESRNGYTFKGGDPGDEKSWSK